jgi:adenylylsulfate kinase
MEGTALNRSLLMDSKQIYPHQHKVSRSMRSGIKGHEPLVIWLTGLSGSGKSTIANELEYRLVTKHSAHTYLLDGDNIRTGLNAGLGFSDEDRKENIRRIGEVAKLMHDAGLIVITAFISPFRSDRDLVRNLFAPGEFWELFVSCPIEVCMQRDPKGLYMKAQKGEITQFTGINSPYEEPLAPELVVESSLHAVDECVSNILAKMISSGILKK